MSPNGSRYQFTKTLAILGAGAAGLTVTRHALACSIKPTVFEQSGEIGGTWVYSDNGFTQKNHHSSMYKNLRTNLPKEVMAYLDFPFPSEIDSFMSHERVLNYLQEYSRNYSLIPYIQFHSRVISVSPSSNQTWEIQVEDSSQNIQTHQFDAVAICTGHFSVPKIPSISNLDNFKGLVIHSHSYRNPETFAGMRTVCLGAGPSGVDICLDVATVSPQVYLSHNLDMHLQSMPDNFCAVPGIASAFSNGFILIDGTRIEAEALILCTGYCYSFPYLTDDCSIQVTDDGVVPLYKQLINMNRPTMAFIGLPFLVAPFPLFQLQAQFFLATLDGKNKLPSKQEMEEENETENKEFQKEGLKRRFMHRLGKKQWAYFRDLASHAGCSPPLPVVQKIMESCSSCRSTTPTTYRNYNFVITSSDSFEAIPVNK